MCMLTFKKINKNFSQTRYYTLEVGSKILIQGEQKLMLNLSESNVRVFLFTKHKILIKNVSIRYM